MATLQDTIGAAIGDVILTFTAVTIAAAEYGNTWADVGQHAEKGRCLVVPIAAEVAPATRSTAPACTRCSARATCRLD